MIRHVFATTPHSLLLFRLAFRGNIGMQPKTRIAKLRCRVVFSVFVVCFQVWAVGVFIFCWRSDAQETLFFLCKKNVRKLLRNCLLCEVNGKCVEHIRDKWNNMSCRIYESFVSFPEQSEEESLLQSGQWLRAFICRA